MPVPMVYGETEQTPLLANTRWNSKDIHEQFCRLAGIPPSNVPKDALREPTTRRSLYGRAVHKRNVQNRTYMFTAALTNTLLLSQVVLGAALTGLGASESSHILITVFGALNTIIAGLVAYLKSRGQPMRARMFRDDLDRVVDEMENSEVMWLGIQSGAHGYDEIAIDDSVSVRSEVARLTRLYDKVVRNNTMNDRKPLSLWKYIQNNVSRSSQRICISTRLPMQRMLLFELDRFLLCQLLLGLPLLALVRSTRRLLSDLLYRQRQRLMILMLLRLLHHRNREHRHR